VIYYWECLWCGATACFFKWRSVSFFRCISHTLNREGNVQEVIFIEIMSKLQTPQHKGARSFLRVTGPLIAGAGLIFLIIGMTSFFSAFGGGGPPRLFWCCFVGMPLLFVGGVMCMFGFMGAVARYTAAEQVPVATDAINDLAEDTQDAVKTVARAVAEGVKEAQTERKQ
jgi:hypothetical protein